MNRQTATHGLKDCVASLNGLIIDNATFLVDRYERPSAGMFIDTKTNLLTGRDFARTPSNPRTVFDADIVYGWIQGRGLEALAGHIEWLRQDGQQLAAAARLEERLLAMLTRVVPALEALRERCGGRLSFMVAESGDPLCVGAAGEVLPLTRLAPEPSFTDLFYSKGLFAAARVLEDAALVNTAATNFHHVVESILDGCFVTDQQPMDPKNPVSHVAGRISQGPTMIALGGIARLIAAGADIEWWRLAQRALSGLLERHVNHGQFEHLLPFDYVEFVDGDGHAWSTNGQVICDPGHALEFVGLAGKVVLAMSVNARTDAQHNMLNTLYSQARELLPAVFKHVFALGFNSDMGGIIKAYDLCRREPINTDMPWWSLPETMRAAAQLGALFPELDVTPFYAAFRACHGAYIERYVADNPYQMAYQTRNASGEPVDVIPATPDADPGYHTGLSVIDALSCITSPAGS